MHDLYELKETLCRKLEEYGRKGEVTTSSLEVIDKLAHAVKNIGKVIEMDEESGDGGYSSRMSYARGGYSRQQGGGRGGNTGGGGSNASYARGRGRNAQRDSMGRYSGTGDSVSEMAMTLGEMMGDLPEELRGDAERFMRKLDSMM